MKTLHRLLLPLCLLAGVVTARAQYTVTSFVNLGANTSAYDINDSGVVVGYRPNTSQAFRYSGGVITEIGAGTAYAINNSGTIVGQTSGDQAFIYSGGTLTEIGAGKAYDINSSGTVAGTNGAAQAFIYAGGAVTWSDNGGSFGNSTATGINNNDYIVGWRIFSTTYDSFFRAGAGAYSSGTIPGTGSFVAKATAINNLNQVVGVGTNDHAFRLDGTIAAGFIQGTPVDLGTLGGDRSWATDINDNGWVVGFSNRTNGTSTYYPFLYLDGTMYDLQAMVAPFMSTAGSPGFTNLTQGGSIASEPWISLNNSGQIVGSGSYFSAPGNSTQAYIMNVSAIPEPSTYAMLAGLLALGIAGRRRWRVTQVGRESF